MFFVEGSSHNGQKLDITKCHQTCGAWIGAAIIIIGHYGDRAMQLQLATILRVINEMAVISQPAVRKGMRDQQGQI